MIAKALGSDASVYECEDDDDDADDGHHSDPVKTDPYLASAN